MTLRDVQERLAAIRAAAGDSEIAHRLQDALYEDVLAAIASGDTPNCSPGELAQDALLVQMIRFPRWMA